MSLIGFEEERIPVKTVGSLKYDILQHKTEIIYDGISGVVLFFIELYKKTKEKRYLDASFSWIIWLENYCDQNPTDRYSFITGRMGVPFTMIRMFDVTADGRYLESALKISRQCPDFLLSSRTVNEYLSGISGTLLVLLDLYAYTQEKWILKAIDKFIHRLISGAYNGAKGLYWDRTPNNIRGLCGFAHGAAGTGLTRLRAFELLGKALYLKEAIYAIEKTKLTNLNSLEEDRKHCYLSLCHGQCGNTELFLEAYKIINDEKYLRYAKKIADKVLKLKDVYSREFSPFVKTNLFLGTAGIGYFYLRLIDPFKVPSILTPKVKLSLKSNEVFSNYAEITVSLANIRQRVISKMFKRTLHASRNLISKALQNYFESKILEYRKHEIYGFTRFMRQVMQCLPKNKQSYILDIFNFELEKIRMDKAIKSNVHLKIKEYLNSKEARKIMREDNESFLNTEFILNQDVKIILTKWNWPLDSSNGIYGLNNEHAVLLKPTPMGILEEYLPPFTYFVLLEFQHGFMVRNVLKKMVEYFETDSLNQEEIIKETTLLQIEKAILSGILLKK